ncbi:glycosyltransferase [Olleya sp. AH-315-F22]|nr:glycosyltransferase [Olleya sp. AH-315-F22]
MPKLSIITINFNNDKCLEATIKSVIQQNYSNYEFIIIDGNSTDDSKSVINTYKSYLSYWVSEPDNGIYNAMNKGINQAKSDYLLFLNSGDSLIDDTNILEDIHGLLQDDIVAFDCLLFRDGKQVGKRTHIEKPTLFYVYKYGFKHQSTFIKRTLFETFGLYNESYNISGDYEFWIRCVLSPETKIRGYNKILSNFQLGGISQRSNWGEEHRVIEQKLLPHLIEDFGHYDKLLAYDRSRVLKPIVKIYSFVRKQFRKIK